MLSLLLEDLSNRINIIGFISINQDIVLIDDDKKIKLFSQDLVDVALEAC